MNNKLRKKILVISTFPIYPPNTGGRIRIHNVSKELSKRYNIVHFSQCINKNMLLNFFIKRQSYEHVRINDNYRIIQSYGIFYNLTSYLASIINSQNFFASFALNITEDKRLTKEIKEASLIIIWHPWLFEWANKISHKYNIPVVFIVNDFETELLKDFIPNILFKKQLVNYLVNKEKNVHKLIKNVVYLTEGEKEYFKIKEEAKKNVCILPMWADNRLFKIKRTKRQNNDYLTVLFVGSNWRPNIEALKFIVELAKGYEYNKKLRFVVAGSVGENRKSTKNLIYTGRVRSILSYYEVADMFINPVTTGSGVNYKMIEAMAASLPIITTSFGARGIELIDNKSAIICDLPLFKENIKKLIDDEKLRITLGKNARKLATEKYNKKKVIKEMYKFYTSILK